jgi:hypothetical protein
VWLSPRLGHRCRARALAARAAAFTNPGVPHPTATNLGGLVHAARLCPWLSRLVPGPGCVERSAVASADVSRKRVRQCAATAK